MRIFLANGPPAMCFRLTRVYQRGNMNCKACQELCRSLDVRTDSVAMPKLASPLECAITKNTSVSALECAVAKSLDLKCRGINTYKKGVGGPPWRSKNYRVSAFAGLAPAFWLIFPCA